MNLVYKRLSLTPPPTHKHPHPHTYTDTHTHTHAPLAVHVYELSVQKADLFDPVKLGLDQHCVSDIIRVLHL
jgi:ABC-type nickel/cobalt efflux system permease component RcnA